MKSPQFARRRGRNRPPQPRIPLKAFIGYADLPAVRMATATIADAIRDSGRQAELHPMLWRSQQMESAHWRERAMAAALEADIVVLASSTPGTLSPAMEAWINDFLAAGRGRSVTLVAISGPHDAWTISLEQPAANAATRANKPEPIRATKPKPPPARKRAAASAQRLVA